MTTEPCCASRPRASASATTHVLRGIDLDVTPGRAHRHPRRLGLGQEHAAALPQLHGAAERRHVELDGQAIGRERARPIGRRSYDEAELTRVRQRVGMVFQQFNLFPHMTALGNVMEGLRTVRGMRKAEARGARREGAGARRPGRQGRGLSGAPLGRPEAARRHRPRAGDGPRGAAVRRADLGARSRAGRRGAARDPLARRGRPHHAAGHARARLRLPRRHAACSSSPTARSTSRARPTRC